MADSVSSSSYSYLQTSSGRFSGLASGMDIDSIVEKLMKAESAKMEKLQQQQQTIEWQRDTYRDVNTKLDAFQTELFDTYGKQSSYLMKTSTVSDESKISVNASTSAVGSLTVSSVSSLATSANKVSDASITVSKANGSHTLSELGLTEAAFGAQSGSFKITVDSKEQIINFTIDDTLDSVVKKLQDAGVKDVSFDTSTGNLSFGTAYSLDESGKSVFSALGYDTSAGTVSGNSNITGSFTANSATTLDQIGIAGEGAVTLNVLQKDGTMKETSINYTSTDTIDSFIKKINGSGAGVTAIFGDGKLSISANNTGSIAGGAIQVVAPSDETQKTDTGLILSKFNLMSSATGKLADGTNANYVVNGIKKTSTSNTITESGYTLTLKNTFNETNATDYTGSVTVTSATDTDAIIDRVKSFVELYNGLVETLNGPIKEKKDYDYSPLTDAQKAEMTEDEIKKWEEQAKKGVLRNDSIISSTLSKLRESLYSEIKPGSKYSALYTIGITTTSSFSDGGKLEIDEDKLRAAINEDPDAVANLFTDSENGLVVQMRKIAKSGVEQIEAKAGKTDAAEGSYTIGKNLVSLKERIDDWKERLEDIEDRYYSQFTAMEEAISKANSQSSLFSA